ILADGSATNQITVTSALPEVEADLYEIAHHFGMTLRAYPKPNTRAKQFRLVSAPGQRAQARKTVILALRHIQAEIGMSWAEWARKATVSNELPARWGRAQSAPTTLEMQRLADAASVPVDSLASAARDRADTSSPVARILERAGLHFSTAETKSVPQCV